MPRVIQVRLKNKTTDEHVDSEPDFAEGERPPWEVEVTQHRVDEDDQFLTVVREHYRLSGYSAYMGEYRKVEPLGERVVGRYRVGEYTSWTDTYADLGETPISE